DLACESNTNEATLVPERRDELTTEGGLDVVTHAAVVRKAVERHTQAGIEVSLFIDPNALQIEQARLLGAKAVELQTASYSEAKSPEERARQLDILREAVTFAKGQGLQVHMGHGLTYTNVQPICALPGVEELNIGHSIVSRA